MRKSIIILGMMCLGLTLSAQPGTVGTRPANDPSGKLLTMEETILARELAPQNLYCSWLNENEILMHKEGKWQSWTIKEERYSEYLPYLTLPHAYTEGQNLLVREDRSGKRKSRHHLRTVHKPQRVRHIRRKILVAGQHHAGILP